MSRDRSIVVSMAFLWIVTIHTSGVDTLEAQTAVEHEHITDGACVDIPAGEKRPEFGCFNVAAAGPLQFKDARVYWHLRTFSTRQAAEAVKSPTGIVVEEDRRVWLSELGTRDRSLNGGNPAAVIGPLELPKAKSYTAVLSYAVMRPGDRSRVHTHPGPEAFYVMTGEQCLETPMGTTRTRAGGTAAAAPNVPMRLTVTGTTVRHAFALVIHDSTQERGITSDWIPPGACQR